ncbi:tripartite tricarboxylate transporter substrate binding protein [Roseomonas sp. GCM10028921]
MVRNHWTRRMALTATLVMTTGAAFAAWPEREITLVVNYGAGGNTDVASRELARAMEADLGKPVVVTNRAGALGTLAPAWLTSQRPDGYTVGVVTYSAVAITPLLMTVPYKTEDFAFIGAYGRYRYGVVVRADSPYRTLQDLVDAGKRKPVFFGAPSAPNNLAMFDLGRVTGAKFEQVSYKSGNETVVALLSGQVEVIVQNPSDVTTQIEAGQLRLLASASPIRWPEYPQVPTMREAGLDVEIDSWLSIAVPRATPPDIVARLEASMIAATRSPALVQAFQRLGVDPAGITGREYERMVRVGYDRTRESVAVSPLPAIAQ